MLPRAYVQRGRERILDATFAMSEEQIELAKYEHVLSDDGQW